MSTNNHNSINNRNIIANASAGNNHYRDEPTSYSSFVEESSLSYGNCNQGINRDRIENLIYEVSDSVSANPTPTTSLSEATAKDDDGISPFDPTPIDLRSSICVDQVNVDASALRLDPNVSLDVMQDLLDSGQQIADVEVCSDLNSEKMQSSAASFLLPSESSVQQKAGDDASFRPIQVEKWNQKFSELKDFRREFGHCMVPLYYPKNRSLSHWVKRQRYQYRVKKEGKYSTLTDERQKALESCGFVWDSHAIKWEERLQELRQFKERYGHCNVPKKCDDNPQLGTWVKCQRRQFKLRRDGKVSTMTRDRVRKLLELGFVFDPMNASK